MASQSSILHHTSSIAPLSMGDIVINSGEFSSSFDTLNLSRRLDYLGSSHTHETIDYSQLLSLEIWIRILRFLSFRDVLRLESLSRHLQSAVHMHLKLVRTINLVERGSLRSLPVLFDDVAFGRLPRLCPRLESILGFFPSNLSHTRPRFPRPRPPRPASGSNSNPAASSNGSGATVNSSSSAFIPRDAAAASSSSENKPSNSAASSFLTRPPNHCLHTPNVLHTLKMFKYMRAIEINNAQLLTAILRDHELHHLQILGAFWNSEAVQRSPRDGPPVPGGMYYRVLELEPNMFALTRQLPAYLQPQQPELSAQPPLPPALSSGLSLGSLQDLHLEAVTIASLPRMESVRTLYLRFVRFANADPFQGFEAPHLESFVLSNCVGPSHWLYFLRLVFALSHSPLLERLELTRVPLFGAQRTTHSLRALASLSSLSSVFIFFLLDFDYPSLSSNSVAFSKSSFF